MKMEQGSLRCDANISLRQPGSRKLGVKTEVKNMNSFRAVELALITKRGARRRYRAGRAVIQQTCHWDEARKVTVPLRSKKALRTTATFPIPTCCR